MQPPIIEVKNIGKKYDINRARGGYVTLREVLMNIIKKPFSFLKGKVKQAAGLQKKEEFWALRGVDFNVEKGEIIGIIGANGAGKSTLLKILSQITPPTEGEIRIHGKVGSLLEVGTGFHPELSGRENTFLNGAILGMTQKEIAKKFDEIVEFSGIGKFIDTPVKYYSSGMYVRLAFSVAAHMDPDILIVDEVLAVGDAEFQKKCLGKMEEVTKQEGRTILFVSHNLQAIKQLCSRCILISSGKIIKSGDTDEVVDYYLNKEKNLNSVIEYKPKPETEAQITKISILDDNRKPNAQIDINQKFYIEVEYEAYRQADRAMLCFSFFCEGDLVLNSSDADDSGSLLTYLPGKHRTTIEIPSSLFTTRHYSLEVAIKRPGVEFLDRKENIPFEITSEDDPRLSIYQNHIPGKVAVKLHYDTKNIE